MILKGKMKHKSISAYDFDDTLIATVLFADNVGAENKSFLDTSKRFPDYFKKIRSLFYDKLSKEVSFQRQGDYIVIINSKTNKPFDSSHLQYFPEKKYQRYFTIKDGILTLNPPPNFHSEPETVGSLANQPVIKEYEQAQNKMILTGRDEKLRPVIEKRLQELQIEFPNYGLKLYPGNPSIKEFKAQTIVDSIQENNWDEVHFYEDREDWLHYAEGVVNEKFPNVKFVPHHISNIKNSRTL